MRLRDSSMKPEKQKENPVNLFCNTHRENGRAKRDEDNHSDIFSTSTSDTVDFLMEIHFSGYQDVGEGLYTHTHTWKRSSASLLTLSTRREI